MKKYLYFALILSITSCVSTRYTTDRLAPIDHDKYGSFILEDHCSTEINPVMQQRIKNSVYKELTRQNLIANRSGDILVKYYVKNQRTEYITNCLDEYNRWDRGSICREKVVMYDEGSLVIDIIDTNENAIIWHGSATGPQWDNIRNPNTKVDKIVTGLLTDFFK